MHICYDLTLSLSFFPSFVQVDASLLEYFRFHHAVCLNHYTKFANGLKAAITKENITLVCKVTNYQRRLSGLPPINLEINRPSVTRRAYDDMLSGAESGNEGILVPSTGCIQFFSIFVTLRHTHLHFNNSTVIIYRRRRHPCFVP